MFQANETFSSEEVAQLSGVTPRQLQWWDERGVVSPHHQGHRRRYRLEELIEVAVIAELRDKGFSLQKVRRVLRFLQRELGRRLAEVLKPGSEHHLLTDGKAIFLEDNQKKIVDILKNSRQPIIAVCLSDQVKRLTASARQRDLFKKRAAREVAERAVAAGSQRRAG